VRKFVVVAMVAMTVALAGCTTSAAGPTGVVTGVTYACQGLALRLVRSFMSGSASTRDRASSPRRQSAQVPSTVSQSLLGRIGVTGWWGSTGVLVRADHRVTADFFDTCD